ncbi:hypothetical protein [Actinoplanes sp. NPDC051494]|uniref:hypothetical protein n=1 Tax=Actinoplanes sp. NPDC051494 TaxID=3363907 RepID=UPI0037B6910B
MESTSTAAPAPTRVWARRFAIGVACVPVAVLSVLHSMGRSADFGVLGRWYVMIPLTIAAVLAWQLVEKTVERVVPAGPPADSAADPATGPATSPAEECPER